MIFGQRYFAELRSKHKGIFWRAEVAARDYTGAAEEMTFAGTAPLTITWEQRGDEFTVPVKGSETSINILCPENFRYLGLFTSDARKWRVSVFRNTKLYWRGYITADLYSENFTAPPYTVTIRAVDGFSLLSNVLFLDSGGKPYSGRKSVWELISACISVLELDLDVADWTDLYAEGMNEAVSPLRQVYVDMERLYSVYESPTYRDVLELCLRPFAAQIFQSNGALHIRRAVSLYSDFRPLSYYRIGKEFPTGWLVANNGQTILSAAGLPLITATSRERIESMWDNDINISGESELEIVPALKSVTINVTNKCAENLFVQTGLFDIGGWSIADDAVSLYSEHTLCLTGDSEHQGGYSFSRGYRFEKSAYPMTLEMTIAVGFKRTGGSAAGYAANVTAAYGMKLTADNGTVYYLNDDGSWVISSDGTVRVISETVSSTAPVDRKIEIEALPASGVIRFFIKQTLKGYASQQYGRYYEYLYFRDMSLRMDTGDDYEDSLSYEYSVNPANNTEMSVALPIGDIPNIPNNTLLYSLYFCDHAGKPTRSWHTRGGNDYDSLTGHILSCALRYRQRASKSIAGDMFTGQHIDMNSVVQDDKYLHTGFYVNSMELDCLTDNCNAELVEMPNLLGGAQPQEGDDCIKLADLPFSVTSIVKCGNSIFLKSEEGELYRFDTLADTVESVYEGTTDLGIFEGDDTVVVLDENTVTVIDYRGVAIRSLVVTDAVQATFMGGYIYIVQEFGRTSVSYRLVRPEYKYARSSTRADYTPMGGVPVSLKKSFSAIVVNTGTRAYLHDSRTNTNLYMSVFDVGMEVLSLSDYLFCAVINGNFRIYRRNSTEFGDWDMVYTETPVTLPTFADHTLGQTAYQAGGAVKVWSLNTNTVYTVINLSGTTQHLRGICYIGGQLYIIRESSIFRFISPNNQ